MPDFESHHFRAIDIALLPRCEEMDFLCELNAELRRDADDEIRLSAQPGAGEAFPHLSLAMGRLNLADLPRLQAALQAIARVQPSLILSASGFATRGNSRGGLTSSLNFATTPALTRLHEQSMRLHESYLSRAAIRADLVEADDGDAERSITWINNFAAAAAFTEFWPHITIGHGGPIRAAAPVVLRFDRLGIYALGPGCTCRQELAGFQLKS